METHIQEGKDFIENELKYSFNSMETKSFANRLLRAFIKGFEISKNYWQKGMLTQEKVDELLDQQVCLTTAQMLEKQSETEKRLDEYIKLHFNRPKLNTDTDKLEMYDIGFTAGSNAATKRLTETMYSEDEVYRLCFRAMRQSGYTSVYNMDKWWKTVTKK